MKNNNDFLKSVIRELEDHILPFWIDKMQDPRGGFYGRIDGNDILHKDAEKGAVLNARILWAFSASYHVLQKEKYLQMAARARDYLVNYFIDKEYGGVYWSLDASGRPLNTKKQVYALGFAIYGLSEYVRATGDQEALKQAVSLYRAIENHSFDKKRNGYVEAMTRTWAELEDTRLSDKDANERKTMNTHLHIIESYVNLYRVWPDENLRERIINLLYIFIDKIYNPENGHLGLFFDDKWNRRDAGCSYGHDIEASWLLLEAAQVTGDLFVLRKVMPITFKIARAGLEGMQSDGSMIYEKRSDGRLDTDRHSWVQSETVVGCMWLWRYHKEEKAYTYAENCWSYIQKNLCDRVNGEWFWSCNAEGRQNHKDDKAGFWKCPYHNTRMCLEMIELLKD